MTELLQNLVDAIGIGATYALLGLALSLVFSVMGLINFAFGMLIVWGGYAIYQATEWGMPYVAALVAMVVVVVGLSMLMGRVAFRPFRDAPPSTLLLTSFGVALVLQAVAIFIFGDASKSVPSPSWLGNSYEVGGVLVNALQIVTVIAAAAVLVAVQAILNHTGLGLEIRATAEQDDVARLLGVRSDKVLMTVFALSGIVTAVATFLWLAKVGTVGPRADLNPTFKAFIVVIIGGLGTMRGAVIGGLLLGLFESLLVSYLPEGLAVYQTALVFALLTLVLLIRPNGIAGRAVEVSK